MCIVRRILMQSKSKIRDIVLIGMFAALTAVLSQIIVPLLFSPVPINLATLSVFMAGGLLGASKGGMSQLIYVLLGAVGAPVFAGLHGGFGVIIGPTGGYIVGYVIAAILIGLIKDKIKLPKKIYSYVIAMIIGLIAIYTIGTAWFMFVTGRQIVESLIMCVITFIPGDILKIILATFLVVRLRRFVYAYQV
jgi:biotin transport system substrate-specific component